jgi:hypothetical protein
MAIQVLHLDPRIEKQARILRRAGRKAALAADKACRIIDGMRAGKTDFPDVASTTRHGELRLKGCVKYDLGAGYRLLTFRRGSDCFVLFLGSHDDCDRWIENNREFSAQAAEPRCTPLAVEQTPEREPRNDPRPDEADQHEAELAARLTERDLDIVFSGLRQ